MKNKTTSFYFFYNPTKLRFLFLLFLFFISSFSISQTVETDSSYYVNHGISLDKKYIKSCFTDFPKMVISPAKWSKGEWIGAIAVVGTAGFLYSKDKQIMNWVQSNLPSHFEEANTYFFDPYGKGYYTIPLMLGVYGYGVYAKNNKSKTVALDFFKASLYTGIVVTGIKHIAHRSRPFQTDPLNPYVWNGPFKNYSHTSFPSGHTIWAFTFASVVSEHYKNKIWVPITLYSIASLEAYARLGAKKHWASDVLIGGALGYAIGKYVVNHSKYNFMVSPWASNNSYGASMIIPIN